MATSEIVIETVMHAIYSNYYNKVNSNYYLPDHSESYTLPIMDNSNIGARVKAARKARGLSQSDLAKAIGITQPTLSNLEGGRNTSSVKILDMARALQVSPLWLQDGIGEMGEFSEDNLLFLAQSKEDIAKQLADKGHEYLLEVLQMAMTILQTEKNKSDKTPPL